MPYKMTINTNTSIVFDEYSDAFDTFSTLLLAKSVDYIYPKAMDGKNDYNQPPSMILAPIKIRLETLDADS
jgi:hypothetical protein